jgi:hypothetical protein
MMENKGLQGYEGEARGQGESEREALSCTCKRCKMIKTHKPKCFANYEVLER